MSTHTHEPFKRAIRLEGFKCVGCDYDLAGTHIGGTCPECGLPVHQSFEKESSRPVQLNREIWTNAVLSLLMVWSGPFNLIFVRRAWDAFAEMSEYSYLLHKVAHKRNIARLALAISGIAALVGLAVGVLALRLAWQTFA